MNLMNKVQSAYKSAKNNVGKAIVGATMLGIASTAGMAQNINDPYIDMLLKPHDKIENNTYSNNFVKGLRVIYHRGEIDETQFPKKSGDGLEFISYSNIYATEQRARRSADENVFRGLIDLYSLITGKKEVEAHFFGNESIAYETTRVIGEDGRPGWIVEARVKIESMPEELKERIVNYIESKK